jgi:hypothetical protein
MFQKNKISEKNKCQSVSVNINFLILTAVIIHGLGINLRNFL